MKVALYIRISTDDQRVNVDRHKQSTDNQLLALKEFCEKSGYEIYKEYVDKISASGAKERPQFKQMFRDAYQKKFDLVLFWSLDRFTREGTLKTLQYFKELESYGVGWKSYSELYLDSMGIAKDIIISLMAVLAKQETTRISERTIAGIARRRAQGLRIGSPKKQVDNKEFVKCFNEGFSNCALARRFDISEITAKRITRDLIASGELEPTQAPNKITVRDLKREERRKEFEKDLLRKQS